MKMRRRVIGIHRDLQLSRLVDRVHIDQSSVIIAPSKPVVQKVAKADFLASAPALDLESVSSRVLSVEPALQKAALQVRTGDPGNLIDRYVRRVHREGGQIPRISSAPLAISCNRIRLLR